MDAPLRSGRRSSRSFATSAMSMVLATVVMAEMTTGVATTATTATTPTTATTIATAIGGDEFRSLGTNPHLTSACYLLVYPAKGLGSNAGAFSYVRPAGRTH